MALRVYFDGAMAFRFVVAFGSHCKGNDIFTPCLPKWIRLRIETHNVWVRASASQGLRACSSRLKAAAAAGIPQPWLLQGQSGLLPAMPPTHLLNAFPHKRPGFDVCLNKRGNAANVCLTAVHFPHSYITHWTCKTKTCREHLRPFPRGVWGTGASYAHITQPPAPLAPHSSWIALVCLVVETESTWIIKYSQNSHFKYDILQKNVSIPCRDVAFWKVLSGQLLPWVNPQK